MNPCASDFADDVISCVDDITALLPRLFAKFDQRVVVTAMAEHIGSALNRLLQSGEIAPGLARRFLAMIESTAFFISGTAAEGEDPAA